MWTITENAYYLEYDANGGTNAPPTQNGTNYSTESLYTFAVISSEPTFEGHRFLEWSTDLDATVAGILSGSMYTLTKTGITTFYAV